MQTAGTNPWLPLNSPGTVGSKGTQKPPALSSTADGVIIVIKAEASVTKDKQLNYRSESWRAALVCQHDNHRQQMKPGAPIVCNCIQIWEQIEIGMCLQKVTLPFIFSPFLVHGLWYKHFHGKFLPASVCALCNSRIQEQPCSLQNISEMTINKS